MKKKNKILPKKKQKKVFPEQKEIEEEKYIDEFMDSEDNDDPGYPFEEKPKQVNSGNAEQTNNRK